MRRCKMGHMNVGSIFRLRASFVRRCSTSTMVWSAVRTVEGFKLAWICCSALIFCMSRSSVADGVAAMSGLLQDAKSQSESSSRSMTTGNFASVNSYMRWAASICFSSSRALNSAFDSLSSILERASLAAAPSDLSVSVDNTVRLPVLVCAAAVALVFEEVAFFKWRRWRRSSVTAASNSSNAASCSLSKTGNRLDKSTPTRRSSTWFPKLFKVGTNEPVQRTT
mmetsp:Transcript_121979/g.304384  ORF Transcript_121979/g.304384 Transcript_121979/m.304384 type:complete len:224 (-) Transcript_121979:706-1377(-)